MDRSSLFEKIFGSDKHDGELLLDQGEKDLAAFVFNVACNETVVDSDDEFDFGHADDDTASVVSFQVKIETAIENFERVIDLFKKTRKAKKTFLKNFEEWSPRFKENVALLKNCAGAIQTDKFNSDISKVVGGVVGALGSIAFGISFLTPLAAVTVPLAIGGGVASALGGAVAAGTSITELALLKVKLNEAKNLIKKEEESFSAMAHWFTYPEELKKAIEALLDYGILKSMADDVKNCFAEARRRTNMTVGQFKEKFEEVVRDCVHKMKNGTKIDNEFGKEISPFVMTFIFVFCIMKGQNRIILNCIMITQSVALGLNLLDIGAKAGKIFAGMAVKGAAEAGEQLAKFAITEILVTVGLVIDLYNVVLSSIDLHKRPDTEVTKKIKDAVEKLEKSFDFIERVYSELKKYESMVNVEEWRSIIVEAVPEDAEKVDIIMAVKPYLAKEAADLIKLQKLPTKGNNWLVQVPEIHSNLLLLQPSLSIKGKPCEMKL